MHKSETAFGCVFIAGNFPIGTSATVDQSAHQHRASWTQSDWTSFCRWAIYVTCLPAWVGCLVKVPSTGRTTFASYPPLPLDRDCEARVDPDITGTGTGPTTLESTPSAHATRATRPATYLSTRWGTDGHGSAGLPEMSEYCAESVLLYVFYVCEAASFVSPYTATVECRVTCTGHL